MFLFHCNCLSARLTVNDVAKPELELMMYYQFKRVWLMLVDVRAELRNRHEKFNRLLPAAMLLKKLELLVNLEEKQEARTLLEANNALEDERIAKERRDLVHEAQLLSQCLLAEAFDAAGQVYVFGKGAFDRLDGEPVDPDFVEFMDYEMVKQLWRQRVRPDRSSFVVADALKTVNDTKNALRQAGGRGGVATGNQAQTDVSTPSIPSIQYPSHAKISIATATEAFSGRQISLATAFLWGKRISHVSCGLAVAYALTDSGEAFCWGGNKRQWRYFYDDKTYVDDESKTFKSTMLAPGVVPHDNRSVQQSTQLHRPLTTRSEMLKLSIPSQVSENQTRHEEHELRRKYRQTFVKPEPRLATETEKRDRLQMVGRFYDLLPPAGDPLDVNPSPTYHELLETVEPELHVDDMALALQMRGVYLEKQTRIEMMEILGECIELELECVGKKFHDHLKEQDKVARRLRQDRRNKQVLAVAARTAMMWNELKTLRDDMITAERGAFQKSRDEYLAMKQKIEDAKQRMKRQAREGFTIPDADNPEHSALAYLNGLTARGPPKQFLRGDQALSDIAVGSRHALAILHSGKLLSWGVGSFGRLGGARSSDAASDRDDPEVWHQDTHTAQVVPSLKNVRFRSVVCGFGHSIALTSDGKVYVWGSATHGKLGVGKVNAQESFSVAPILLSSLVASSLAVRKIACGPSHSALLTVDGALFVWGSGDGGKLGLGDGRFVGEDRVPRNGGNLGIVEVPTRVVEPFGDERIVELSCGSAHTAVLTEITRKSNGAFVGGRLFVAGSSHALGKFSPTFTHVPIPASESARPIEKVGCGNAHTAVVTCDGELYSWGHNVGGCTGHPIAIPLVKVPTLVTCMYQAPVNLSLRTGVTTTLSSQNASCCPEYALGLSSTDGALFAQSQQEMCPFWDMVLAERSRVSSIRIVLRSVGSGDLESTMVLSTKRPQSTSSTNVVRYAVLVSEMPFNADERGKYSLAVAKSHSVHTTFALHNDRSEFVWHMPSGDAFGQFVRVQLENGIGMLSLSRVEVYGTSADSFVGPRVSDVVCGEGITMAICRAAGSRDILRDRFLRALRADYENLWTLRQLETFHAFLNDPVTTAYSYQMTEKHQRKEGCVLCRPREQCAVCSIEEMLFNGPTSKRPQQRASDAGQTWHASTKEKATELKQKKGRKLSEPRRRKSSNIGGQQLPPPPPPRLTLEELCHQMLSLNTRTEEEEAEAKRKLDQELSDLNPLALGKQEEDAQLAAEDGANTSRQSKMFRKLAFSGLLAKTKKPVAT